jgi:hypothetical protein
MGAQPTCIKKRDKGPHLVRLKECRTNEEDTILVYLIYIKLRAAIDFSYLNIISHIIIALRGSIFGSPATSHGPAFIKLTAAQFS